MYSFIQRFVVETRKLISSFQLFYFKSMSEKSDLSGPGLHKVTMAKVTGCFCWASDPRKVAVSNC